MVYMTLAEEQIANRMKELLSSVPTYSPSHFCYAKIYPKGTSLGYRTKGWMSAHTFFDAHIEKEIGYVLYIQRDKEIQGRGIGRAMYLAIEQLFREQGCTRVELTPSGSGKKGIWESLGFMPKGDGTLCKQL